MARNNDTRSKILEILAENPFISYACRKVGISRLTFYRWKKDNVEFRKKVELALTDGRDQLVEIAEIGLIKSAKAGNIGAIKFILENNSLRYARKYSIDPIPPKQREEWERMRKENIPVYEIPPEKRAHIMQAMKNFGYLNADGSFSDQFIKENPVTAMQWIREDEALKRKQKGLPG